MPKTKYCCNSLIALVKETWECSLCEKKFCEVCMDLPQNYLICGCVAGGVDRAVWEKEKKATRTEEGLAYFIEWLCKPCKLIVSVQLKLPRLAKETHR